MVFADNEVSHDPEVPEFWLEKQHNMKELNKPSAVCSLLSYREHSRNKEHKRFYRFPSKILLSTLERMHES